MQRNEAIAYLKQILSSNEQISPDAVTLEQRKDSTGYRLHIREISCQSIVKEIAQKYNLAIKEENGEIIIYEPL